MRCLNCGKELKDDMAVFCDKCYKEMAQEKKGVVNNATVSSSSSGKKSTNKNKNSGKNNKKKIIILICVILVVAIALSAVWIAVQGNKINRDNLSGNLGITETAEFPFDCEVKNIVLYGIDARTNTNKGRSDAILLLSIDKNNNQIKLTSIARDSYISFENGKHDKLTHAWSYGGADLAVKTLNRNFNLDVTDYVCMNFFQFARIIDYIGGVDIDVNEAEKNVMNKNYIGELNRIGIKCDYITQTGMQHLSGGQALAYARNRYTGSDLERGNRQREVLQAMFEVAMDMNKIKYPKLIDIICDDCTTSLSNKEMLSIGWWTLSKDPEFVSMGIPNGDCDGGGQMINGTYYMVYNLDKAKKYMHDFIYNKVETESSSSIESAVSSAQ